MAMVRQLDATPLAQAGRCLRAPEVLAELGPALRRHGRAALCQIVRSAGSTPGKAGWKLLVLPDGSSQGNLGGGAFEAMVKADAADKLACEVRRPESLAEMKRYYLTEEAVKGEATGMVCGGMVEVFLEVLAAPPVLVVCGGGPVGQALSRVAAVADFEVVVAEDREDFLHSGLFAPGTRIERVERGFARQFLAGLLQRDLYVAVVSRCWQTDTAALASVLRQQPARLCYLGLMGSRRKVARVMAELGKRGHDLASLPFHAPIGLPIGGDSPGEIAVSILAEVIGKRYEAPA